MDWKEVSRVARAIEHRNATPVMWEEDQDRPNGDSFRVWAPKWTDGEVYLRNHRGELQVTWVDSGGSVRGYANLCDMPEAVVTAAIAAGLGLGA